MIFNKIKKIKSKVTFELWGHFDPLRSEILESENGYRNITLSSQYIRGSHVSQWSDTADQEPSILKRPGLLTTSHM